MSQNKLTQKWTVASFFDNPQPGFEFPREDTPLHATLAGVFAIDLRGDDIAQLLKQCIAEVTHFSVKGKTIETWGDGLHVTRLDYSEDFNRLYTRIQDCLLQQGAIFNEPQYLHEGFTPHATVQKQQKLTVGESVNIARVSLVDMFPGGNGYRRRIHATIHFGDISEA